MGTNNEVPSKAILVREMLDMARAYRSTQLLYTAASLGLLDQFAAGTTQIDALAEKTGTHAPSLARLMRALATIGLLAEGDDGQFAMTPLARLLLADREDSLRDVILHSGGDMYRAWGELEYSVRTGAPSFPKVFGMSNWERRQQNPAVNVIFNGNQAAQTRIQGSSVVETYPFPQEGLVVDVGGGDGTLISLVLKKYPHLQGLLLDQPHVVEQAAAVLAKAGVSDRCRTEAGDFFDSVPSGGNAYILSRVLNDWDNQKGQEILQRCREAMTPSARLILVTDVISKNDRDSALADLHMLVTQGGRGRTEEEWRELLKSGGFNLSQSMATSTTRILEALPT